MNELQLYHWAATGALTLLVGILSYLGKNLIDDMKTKLSKDEFAAYLQDAKVSRAEIRDTIIKLFEKIEAHDKVDGAKFESIIKDFNGGMQAIRETLNVSKLEIFDRINTKVDR